MTVGVAAKPFRTFGWHTYTWTTYYPPVDTAAGGIWNTFSSTVDTQPDALSASGKVNYNGTVSVRWGTRPGCYSGQSLPIPVSAGVTFNYRLTQLKRHTTYYINAEANVSKPAAAGGLSQSAMAQYGEVSSATS